MAVLVGGNHRHAQPPLAAFEVRLVQGDEAGPVHRLRGEGLVFRGGGQFAGFVAPAVGFGELASHQMHACQREGRDGGGSRGVATMVGGDVGAEGANGGGPSAVGDQRFGGADGTLLWRVQVPGVSEDHGSLRVCSRRRFRKQSRCPWMSFVRRRRFGGSKHPGPLMLIALVRVLARVLVSAMPR